MSTDPESIRTRFLAVDTTTVSDVLEQVGCHHQALATHLVPIAVDQPKLAGFAYTVRGQLTPYAGPGDPDKMAAIDGMKPGVVSIWAGDAEGMACFGELLALGMKRRGCVGAVVNGGVRDSHWIAKHGVPIYARYRSPVQSIGRWKVTGCQIPVAMPGATAKRVDVVPGDFILGDADGVVVVPAAHIEAVLTEAEKITARENRIRTEIDDGAALGVILGRYGRV
ncbi:MAG: RraA family protein [Burkholderiales bacterium]|nr:RraA family protein [Burkholderiales bacterium]